MGEGNQVNGISHWFFLIFVYYTFSLVSVSLVIY